MLRCPVRDGLELRLPEEKDVDELFDAIERNRAQLEQWLHWAHSTHSREDVLRFIESARKDFVRPDALHLLIFREGRIIGSCGLLINEVNSYAEIGYWIDLKFAGQGITTDCCRTLVDYAFLELDLYRVQIRCATRNERSAAVAKRLGFVYEGVHRQCLRTAERLDDEACYGLLRSDWAAAK